MPIGFVCRTQSHPHHRTCHSTDCAMFIAMPPFGGKLRGDWKFRARGGSLDDPTNHARVADCHMAVWRRVAEWRTREPKQQRPAVTVMG